MRGRDSPAVARNMSAPPRTTLSFSALVPAQGGTGDAVADGTGLDFVCRLDARALLPGSRRNASASMFDRMEPAAVQHRIRVALVYALMESGGQRRARPGAFARANAAPIEAVADELRDLLAEESLGAAGLPQFGMLLPAGKCERTIVGSFRRTLAILARRRDALFLRDADPIVWSALTGEVLDLWTPAAGRGRLA